MDRYRDVWMLQMLGREMRMVDMQIVAALQNGTAFFASTSLIAVGGALTLLRSTDDDAQVVGDAAVRHRDDAREWEIKMIGLAIIFVYAFFKFAWSYRLYNYVAILFGATPLAKDKDTPEAKAHAERRRGCSRSPAGTSTAASALLLRPRLSRLVHQPVAYSWRPRAVALVLWRRQFASDSRRALFDED